jgi:hypothetical protein
MTDLSANIRASALRLPAGELRPPVPHSETLGVLVANILAEELDLGDVFALTAIGACTAHRALDLVELGSLSRLEGYRRLARLQDRGFVERIAFPEDHRSKYFRISDEGRRVLERLTEFFP